MFKIFAGKRFAWGRFSMKVYLALLVASIVVFLYIAFVAFESRGVVYTDQNRLWIWLRLFAAFLLLLSSLFGLAGEYLSRSFSGKEREKMLLAPKSASLGGVVGLVLLSYIGSALRTVYPEAGWSAVLGVGTLASLLLLPPLNLFIIVFRLRVWDEHEQRKLRSKITRIRHKRKLS